MTLLDRFSEGERFYPLYELAAADPLLTILSSLFFFRGISECCWMLGWSLGEMTLIELLLIIFICELLFIMTRVLSFVVYRSLRERI